MLGARTHTRKRTVVIMHKMHFIRSRFVYISLFALIALITIRLIWFSEAPNDCPPFRWSTSRSIQHFRYAADRRREMKSKQCPLQSQAYAILAHFRCFFLSSFFVSCVGTQTNGTRNLCHRADAPKINWKLFSQPKISNSIGNKATWQRRIIAAIERRLVLGWAPCSQMDRSGRAKLPQHQMTP